jgi:hypothetical protein
MVSGHTPLPTGGLILRTRLMMVGLLWPLAHAHANSRVRKSREDHPGEGHTSRISLLVKRARSREELMASKKCLSSS